MSDVLVQLIGGAWFVSFTDTNGVRQSVLKANSKRKGFRRMEHVISLLKHRQGIEVFSAEAR
jgi:hypothetical protein